ncbi:hypothetical protein [Armatimonas sp.]|uniref:hypothetical protein n=1 Tax=Armatimonas sp. TaxID=1872638 RepID=UPI0037539419
MSNFSLPSLFDDDDTLEPSRAEVIAAYAQILCERPPIRSCDAAVVGSHKARRAAAEFAQKDVMRYAEAVTLAKKLRKERSLSGASS